MSQGRKIGHLDSEGPGELDPESLHLIERGEGFNALREMVEQNTKAISLLKGSDKAAMFDEQVRPLLGEVQQT